MTQLFTYFETASSLQAIQWKQEKQKSLHFYYYVELLPKTSVSSGPHSKEKSMRPLIANLKKGMTQRQYYNFLQLTPIQKEWILALWNQEYPQTQGLLQKGNAFCCLGVGCKVAEKNGIEIILLVDSLHGTTLESQLAVKEALELRSATGEGLNSISLVRLNDADKRTHHEIAANLLNRTADYFKNITPSSYPYPNHRRHNYPQEYTL